ncbi:MAG: sigma-54-dependent Fis family transcriptional regulator [Deltaproteobacteria bacterium]|nr:sigma-54-dependent Fis family transcriptional regulator [Deltaproteobacteria bacterium]
MDKRNILIVDDEQDFAEGMQEIVELMGHGCDTAGSISDALRMAGSGGYDIVFLDVFLPDGNGLDSIRDFQSSPSGPDLIVLTGIGDPDGAALAIKSGVWDYLTKPATVAKIRNTIQRVLHNRDKRLKDSKVQFLERSEIVGDSPQIAACLQKLAKASRSSLGVLITGETGTGKELFARAIHANSSRRKGPFVILDCASLPKNLIESILFGHVKGAFTGAESTQTGIVKQADGGTLFLDEVGELPKNIQRAFLRVLQTKQFRPVGGDKELSSDFRVVSATNKNLDEMVESGHFRKDLFFRLNTMTIDLPPLRERGSDLRILITHYLCKTCEDLQIPPKGVSDDLMSAMHMYDWPGNVRELTNTIQLAVQNGLDEPTLYPHHLPTYIRVKIAREHFNLTRNDVIEHEPEDGLRTRTPETIPTYKQYREETLAAMERKYFRELRIVCDGSAKLGCRLSGLSRARFYQILKKVGVNFTELKTAKIRSRKTKPKVRVEQPAGKPKAVEAETPEPKDEQAQS